MAAYSITTVHMDDEQDHTVCIIGAGVSGLVTAKVLQRDGFDVTIFEKEPTIGGVWAPSRAYAGLGVQNLQEHYAFTDFPYPETSDEFPTAEQVFEYLKSYVEHVGLEPSAGRCDHEARNHSTPRMGRGGLSEPRRGLFHRRPCGLLRR